MGWFKKKDDVVDLGERYRKQQERLGARKEEVEEPKEGMSFLSGLVNAAQKQNAENSQSESMEYADLGVGIDDRKQRLSKRIIAMTNKMEELSNQIYHLQQRIELIERKMNINLSG